MESPVTALRLASVLPVALLPLSSLAASRDVPGRPRHAAVVVEPAEAPRTLTTHADDEPAAPVLPLEGAYEAPEQSGRRRLEAQVLPMVDEPAPPRLDGQGTIPLSLMDAIDLAAAHALDIHGSRIASASADARIRQSRGAFDPVLNGSARRDKRVQPNAFLFAVPLTQSTTDSYSLGIAQKFWYGGVIDVGVSAVRSESNSNSLSPSFNTDLTLKYTQPLLRGFGRDANRSAIAQAVNSSRISRIGVETRARDVVRDTIRGYWDLVFALRDYEVRRSSLGLANELLRKNRIMVEVGTLAPLEISQAEASVAEREFRIISARNAIGAAEDNLRRLMGVRGDPAWWGSSITPLDEPEFAAFTTSLDDELAVAMQRRGELPAQQLTVENAKLGVSAAKDALLPQLNLELSSSDTGLSGFGDADRTVDSDGDGDPTNDRDRTGGFGSSFDQTLGRDFESYTAALIWSQPLRNRTAEGAYLVQRLALENARLGLEQLKQSIVLEVRKAVRDLDSARESVVSAGAARTLREKTLSAEIKKFENGLSTNFEVLQFQTDLQESESAEIRALISYVQAQADLKRARGTLLEDYGLAAPR